MGNFVTEETVRIVGAILQTLRCPICLELLKVPVSVECGHFFCRECITITLHGNYRAPCPLCKRSYTRRSIQEAPQRQNVILAAKALAKTCSNLTGVDLIPPENTSKRGKKSLKSHLLPAKKRKITLKENQDGVFRKRISCKNEGSISQRSVNHSNSRVQSAGNQNGNNPNLTNDERVYAKNLVGYWSDTEEDSSDLPSLDEIFLECEPLTQIAKVSIFDKLLLEKLLSVTPPEKVSKLITYLNCSREHKSKVKTAGKLNFNTENISHMETETNEEDKQVKQVKIKDEINTLQKKRNNREYDKYDLQEDCFIESVNDCKNSRKDKIINPEQEIESEENELFSNTDILHNQSTVPYISSSTLPESKISKSRSTKCGISQTSQAAFNFDHQNPIYNNLALMPQQSTRYLPQQYPLQCVNPSTGKTKIVKRACLTLEEIQDYFYKSNMNNSSEKIYSFPFLSGQFMLDICVSEETLNVSVLRVIDQRPENNVTSINPVPELSDKGIQSSNSLFNVPSPVLHSPNSSDPNCITEPFPYFNKLSHDLKESRPSSKSAEETIDNIVEQPLKKNIFKISEIRSNLNEDIREDCDVSEIIHFSKEHIQQGNHALQNNIYGEKDHYQNTNEQYQRFQENAKV